MLSKTTSPVTEVQVTRSRGHGAVTGRLGCRVAYDVPTGVMTDSYTSARYMCIHLFHNSKGLEMIGTKNSTLQLIRENNNCNKHCVMKLLLKVQVSGLQDHDMNLDRLA